MVWVIAGTVHRLSLVWRVAVLLRGGALGIVARDTLRIDANIVLSLTPIDTVWIALALVAPSDKVDGRGRPVGRYLYSNWVAVVSRLITSVGVIAGHGWQARPLARTHCHYQYHCHYCRDRCRCRDHSRARRLDFPLHSAASGRTHCARAQTRVQTVQAILCSAY